MTKTYKKNDFETVNIVASGNAGMNVSNPEAKLYVKPKVKIINRKKVEMIISEWSDLPVLSKRIEDKYNAKIVSKNDICATFKGELFEVTLKKI